MIKIEGRQRSQAYVQQVVTVWREAIDTLTGTQKHNCTASGRETLELLLEGTVGSLGALKGA